MKRLAFLCLVLAACQSDETLHAYGAGGAVWKLTSAFGSDVGYDATLAFPKAGQLSGSGPCNRFSATQSAPYPWFEAGQIRATRRACPQLASESAYFDALRAMTLSEVSGDVLVLSDESGSTLEFKKLGPVE